VLAHLIVTRNARNHTTTELSQLMVSQCDRALRQKLARCHRLTRNSIESAIECITAEASLTSTSLYRVKPVNLAGGLVRHLKRL
jgi:hypothetical protein